VSGDPADIAVTDDLGAGAFFFFFFGETAFPQPLESNLARKRNQVSRTCRRASAVAGATESAPSSAWPINESGKKRGRSKRPVVIGRDHLDCGSVASKHRIAKTESMKDGSDAVADWPLLNRALAQYASGASWVFHPQRRWRGHRLFR